MAEKTTEKRKFIWMITNFTREAVNEYDKNNPVESENFEVLLRDNMTKWNFSLYLKDDDNDEDNDNDDFGFYIYKLAVDRDEILIKIDVAIQKSDGTTANIKSMEDPSNIFELGTGWGWSKLLLVDAIFETENKYLANDTLTLIINLELHEDGPPAKKPRLDMAQPEWTAKYFNSKVLSDVTIICSDKKTILAHRFILAGRSSVFEKMLTIDMAEKKSNKITVADIKSDTMMELMRYIYTQKVDDLKKYASKLLDSAEKYDIPDLKQICVQELIEHLSDENIFENLLLAKLYNERKLMHKCMDYIDTRFWKLKDTEEWKKLDNELMVNIMKYMQEKTKDIELANSL